MVQSMEISEFCVLSVPSFAHAAGRDTRFWEPINPVFHNRTGVMLLLIQKVRDLVDAVGFSVILEGYDIAKIRTYSA